MQNIGRGAQYEVFADQDYVYKTLHSVAEAASVYDSWGYRLLGKDTTELATNALSLAALSLQGIRGILEDHSDLAESLAYPVINDDSNYRQDRVDTLGRSLRKANRREAKYLLDQCVDLQLWHTEFGFIDIVFNIGINNGVDRNNRVVLIDLGELTFDKQTAVHTAERKQWQKAYSYWGILPSRKAATVPADLKWHYRNRMQQKFTAKNIAEGWDSARFS